jgi:acetylornithine aminotransferase
MNALELKEPIARALIPEGMKRGVILNATSDTTLRFVPPLIWGEAQVHELHEHLGALLPSS